MTNFLYDILPIIIGLVVGLVGWYIHYQKTHEMSVEIEALQSQNIRLMQSQELLNNQCTTLNSSYKALSETHKRLDFHHNNLQIEFAELKAEKPSFLPVEVDNTALNDQIKDLESQLTSLRAEYADYRNAAVKRVQNTDEQLQILRGQYETMLDSYIEQGQYIRSLDNLTPINAAHQHVKNEETVHQQQYDEQYETMLNKYVQQGQLLKNKTAEIAEWQSHFEDLMLKKNDQDTQLIELEEMRASTTKELEILRGHFEAQQSRNQTLESELTDLNKKYLELEAEKGRTDGAFTSVNTINSVKSSNWELRYNELESRHSTLTRRFHDASAGNERMEKTITGLTIEILQYRRRANPDDLKRIEGIGPKIEELLNDAGIYKYEQLATTKTETLRLILDKAGARFRLHDPQSWATQAELANKNDWTKLKEYQDYLVAGRAQEQPFVTATSR